MGVGWLRLRRKLLSAEDAEKSRRERRERRGGLGGPGWEDKAGKESCFLALAQDGEAETGAEGEIEVGHFFEGGVEEGVAAGLQGDDER
jgi:hypothetical protein